MNRILATTALTALLGTAAAAGIEGSYVTYTVDGMEFEGYVATNTDITPKGTVLIVHDWDGMTEYEERRAEMLAALGYTAFAVDVYGKDENPQSIDDNRRLSGALYADRAAFRARLMGSIEAAATIPGATADMVMMGYCFGGAATLEAARAGADLEGFVSFHGGLGTPEGQDYSMTSAPVMLFHGSADPVSGMADVAALMDELQAAGVPHGAEIFGGARHSFTVYGSRDYLQAADEGAWEGLLEFLDERL